MVLLSSQCIYGVPPTDVGLCGTHTRHNCPPRKWKWNSDAHDSRDNSKATHGVQTWFAMRSTLEGSAKGNAPKERNGEKVLGTKGARHDSRYREHHERQQQKEYKGGSDGDATRIMSVIRKESSGSSRMRTNEEVESCVCVAVFCLSWTG